MDSLDLPSSASESGSSKQSLVGLSGFLMERSQQCRQQCGILRPICALASRCAEIGNTTEVNIRNVYCLNFSLVNRYINLLDVVIRIKLGVRHLKKCITL